MEIPSSSYLSSNIAGIIVSVALIFISIMYLMAVYKAIDNTMDDYITKDDFTSKIKYGWIFLGLGMIFLAFFIWRMNVKLTF